MKIAEKDLERMVVSGVTGRRLLQAATFLIACIVLLVWNPIAEYVWNVVFGALLGLGSLSTLRIVRA